MGLFDFGDSGDPVSGLYGDMLTPDQQQAISSRGRSGISGEIRARARSRAPMTPTSLNSTRAKLRGELMKRAHERVFQGILN
jgi:hypothetical protein